MEHRPDADAHPHDAHPAHWNGRPDPLGGAADGTMIETSHVMIQGLKILGLPVVETPKPGVIRRLYAISRLRRDLEDLEIAQCLFVGHDETNPNHVAIIANGNGVNVHHCVFRGLKLYTGRLGGRGDMFSGCALRERDRLGGRPVLVP